MSASETGTSFLNTHIMLWQGVCVDGLSPVGQAVDFDVHVKLLGAGVLANSLVVHTEHWLPPLGGAEATVVLSGLRSAGFLSTDIQ